MKVKLSNILRIDGTIDYKGIDLKKITPNSQHYKQDSSFCILEIDDVVDIQSNSEIAILTESEYETLKLELKAEMENLPNPLKDVETLKLLVAELGLQIGGTL